MVKVSLKFMKFRSALTIIVSFFSLFSASCSWNPQKQPSVLVIAVEGLSFDSFSCTSELLRSHPDFSGFRVFCDEAVRFTHAYSPSTLSQPALASLLTGLYPLEHKVRNQGGDFLSGKLTTVAEAAIRNNFRTSFISGGAPVWRKSGLSQGMEYFEDNISLNQEEFFRPIKRSMELFEFNLQNRFQESAFFSVIFSNDLMFPSETTTNNSGEIRSRTVDSQLMEISESINDLVITLKRLGRWDNTHVVLTGLNGGLLGVRPGEERGYSLFSSNTQVKLFIKPATKKRDLGLQWTIDRNVSLVDVGKTLFDLVGATVPRESRFSVHSLVNVLKEPNVDWPQGRILLTESSWPSWQGVGIERYSLRMDQYLLIYDQKPQLYNTLIDRQEVSRIKRGDPLVKAPMTRFMEFIKQNELAPWRPLPETLSEKLAIARGLWTEVGIDSRLERRLRHISRKRTWDTQIWGWQARKLIEDQNWKRLKKIGKETGNAPWQYLAGQHVGNGKKGFELEKCEKTLSDFSDIPSLRDCDDPVFSAFAAWAREKDMSQAIHLKERFLRQYRIFLRDQKIAQMNFQNGLTWSVVKKFPAGPSLTEIALSLPRMEGFARQVKSRLFDENL